MDSDSNCLAKGRGFMVKGHEGNFWAMKMFYIFPMVTVTLVYTFVKTQTASLKLVRLLY